MPPDHSLLPEYFEGVQDAAVGLPLDHELCEQRVGAYTKPEQIAAYFAGRRDRASSSLQ
jgi:hypothetical protein